MSRLLVSVWCAIMLPACAHLPDWAWTAGFSGPAGVSDDAAPAKPVRHSFDWELSGDPAVAPVQVFDDGQRTWLQFLPGQVLPAIFDHTSDGERLLAHSRQGDYVLLDGVWPVLTFRGGHLQARAQKKNLGGDTSSDVTVSAVTDPADVIVLNQRDVAVPGQGDVAVAVQGDAAAVDLAEVTVESSPGLEAALNIDVTPGPRSSVAPEIITRSTDAAIAAVGFKVDSLVTPVSMKPVFRSSSVESLTQASFDAIDVLPASSYAISVADGNLREALYRWAKQANWTFLAEHWDVDVDIPVSGAAQFQGTFEDAVQDLLAATELGERPLRPCFYSNRVLRVVSYSQGCDRSSGSRQS